MKKIIDTMRRIAHWIEGPKTFKPAQRFNPKHDVRLAVVTDRRLLLELENIDQHPPEDPLNRPPCYLLNTLRMMPTFPYEADAITMESLRSADDYKRLENHGCVIVHIDKSVRPAFITELLARLPSRVRIMNQHVTDIRKREMGEIVKRFGFDTLEIDPGADPETPVFIKSNWNSGDAPKVVYEHCLLREVPAKVWRDPDLTVQRFVEERVPGLPGCRRLRRFIIAGGEIVHQNFLGTTPLLKGDTSLCWEYRRDVRRMPKDTELLGGLAARSLGFTYYDIDDKTRLISERVQALAQNIGVDFGSIDTIAPDAEHIYILDVNTTPLQRGLPQTIKEILADALAIHVSGANAVSP